MQLVVCYRFRVRQHTSSGKSWFVTKRRGEASGRRKTDCGDRNISFAAGSSGDSLFPRRSSHFVLHDLLLFSFPFKVCCGSRSSDVDVDFLDEALSI